MWLHLRGHDDVPCGQRSDDSDRRSLERRRRRIRAALANARAWTVTVVLRGGRRSIRTVMDVLLVRRPGRSRRFGRGSHMLLRRLRQRVVVRAGMQAVRVRRARRTEHDEREQTDDPALQLAPHGCVSGQGLVPQCMITPLSQAGIRVKPEADPSGVAACTQ